MPDIFDTINIKPETEKRDIFTQITSVRPLQRQPGLSKLQIAQRGGGRWGEMPTDGIKGDLAVRGFKQAVNIVPNIAKKIFSPEGIPNRFIIKGLSHLYNKVLDLDMTPKELEANLVKDWKKVQSKVPALTIDPPEGLGEKVVDIGANVGQFVTELAILRKIAPVGTGEGVLWEMQNLMSGGTPGTGYAMHGAFTVPSKVIKGVTLPARVGRVTAEAAGLAGLTALEQKIDTGEIDYNQVAVAAALPFALRTPKAIKGLIRKRNPKVMKAVAEQQGIDPMVAAMDIDKPVRWAKKETAGVFGAAFKLEDGTIIKGAKDSAHLSIVKKVPKGKNVIDSGFINSKGEYLYRDDVLKATKVLVGEPTVDTANKVITTWSKKAKMLNKTERKAAVKKLRKRQAAISKETYRRLVQEENVPRLTAAIKARRASKGLKAKNPEIEPLKLTSEQQDLYGRRIEQIYPVEYQFQRTGAAEAIIKMTQGRIPTNYEFGLLEPIFGRDATKKLFGELIKKRPFSGWELPALIIQGFKTKFGLDIQMFRQARTMAVRHPVLYLKSSWVNARAYINNKYAERMYTQVKNSAGYMESEKLGWNYVGEAGYSSKRLEYYSLGLTERLLTTKFKSPKLDKTVGASMRAWGKLLGASERGAVAGINNMQKGLYDIAAKNVRRLDLTPAQQKLWMKNRAKTNNTFIKILRVPPGKQYKGLRRLQQVANYLLFSPSMTVSRPLSIKALVANKGSRKYAAGVIASNIASIYAITAIPAIIGHQMRLQNPEEEPDVNGELNVLDGSWGKIRYGEEVFDFSGGDAPFYRTVARIGVSAYMYGKGGVTGKVVTEVVGKRIPDAGDTLKRYIETRETAALGYAETMLTGKDWMGEPIPRFEATVRALSPELIEATVEAGMADGLWGSLATFAAASTSVGVSTYPVHAAATRSKFRDIVSQAKHGTDWDELSIPQQNRLRSEHRKQFEVLSERVRKERIGKPISIERIKEEELRSGKQITAMLSEPNRQWVDDISIGVSRRPKNWYLNDRRYNRYQELVAQYVDERLSKVDFTGMEDKRRVARIQIIVKVAKNKALGTLRREVGR